MDVKIKIGQVELTIEEAHKVYAELAKIFGDPGACESEPPRFVPSNDILTPFTGQTTVVAAYACPPMYGTWTASSSINADADPPWDTRTDNTKE